MSAYVYVVFFADEFTARNFVRITVYSLFLRMSSLSFIFSSERG